MTVNHDVAGSSPVRGAKKKDRFRTVFFLSNPKDWYGITRRAYGIRRKATAWHAPCSPAAYAVALRAMFRQRRNARGAICARSFYKRACRLTSLDYHASACILLRIDYIQHFVLIPYRSKAADSIHGFAVIFYFRAKIETIIQVFKNYFTRFC